MPNKLLILVTNDDGINAKGLKALTELAQQFGKVVVVAPTEGQSGMSHAITVKTPIRVYKISESDDTTRYTCNGTPVDCVKMAINQILPRRPDLILSGINHGGNASSSVLYSGTMAAAIEGCINEIPSIGFSLLEFSRDADFSMVQHYGKIIIEQSLEQGIPKGMCLNVNVPYKPINEISGIKICRQNHGVWREEFEHRTDPNGYDYYWLTGTFEDLEPHAEDTDEWALRNNYVAVVPVQFDFTAHKHLETLKKWQFNGKQL
jgi:5'-nucleotidase